MLIDVVGLMILIFLMIFNSSYVHCGLSYNDYILNLFHILNHDLLESGTIMAIFIKVDTLFSAYVWLYQRIWCKRRWHQQIACQGGVHPKHMCYNFEIFILKLKIYWDSHLAVMKFHKKHDASIYVTWEFQIV